MQFKLAHVLKQANKKEKPKHECKTLSCSSLKETTRAVKKLLQGNK